jgi:hypothetical protein
MYQKFVNQQQSSSVSHEVHEVFCINSLLIKTIGTIITNILYNQDGLMLYIWLGLASGFTPFL